MSHMTRIGYSVFAIGLPMMFVYVLIFTKVINVLNVFWEYLLAHIVWIIFITFIVPFFAKYHIPKTRNKPLVK